MIRGVLFDLGGVVVDFSNDNYYRMLAEKSGRTAKEVRALIENKPLIMLEEGRSTTDEFERNIAKSLGIPKDEIEWYEFYKRAVRINEDVEALVGELKKDYMTAFVSNIDKSRYRYTLKILDLDLFDYRFASCSVGFRKPDRRIMEFALKRMKLKPEEAVFIDNMPENVDSARKIGISAFVFSSRRKLDTDLYSIGL